jgi:DNA-binding MarR family transcriptional regulator
MSTSIDPPTRRHTFILDPMRRIDRAVHLELEQLMADIGFPEVRVAHLAALAHIPRGSGIRMTQLAELMQVTKGAATQIVAHLERHGYLERVRDAVDGRGVIVRPTPAAEEGYEEARARLTELEATWRRRVGSERWNIFCAVLAEIADWQEHKRQS